MSIAPIQTSVIEKSGKPTREWSLFFVNIAKSLTGGGPFKLASYTVATLPPAADNAASIIYVSNESGGATVAFSDSTNWRRVQDRAIVT
jgi:hypothetical protein